MFGRKYFGFLPKKEDSIIVKKKTSDWINANSTKITNAEFYEEVAIEDKNEVVYSQESLNCQKYQDEIYDEDMELNISSDENENDVSSTKIFRSDTMNTNTKKIRSESAKVASSILPELKLTSDIYKVDKTSSSVTDDSINTVDKEYSTTNAIGQKSTDPENKEVYDLSTETQQQEKTSESKPISLGSQLFKLFPRPSDRDFIFNMQRANLSLEFIKNNDEEKLFTFISFFSELSSEDASNAARLIKQNIT